MTRRETDDDIWRYQPVWFEARGYVLPFHARYTAWGLWFLLQTAVFTVLVVLPLSWLLTIGLSLAVSVGLTVRWADWLTPETPMLGRLSTAATEARTWLHTHRRPARLHTVRPHAYRK
jgi:hypothetical protein